jgi:hypothetical protein
MDDGDEVMEMISLMPPSQVLRVLIPPFFRSLFSVSDALPRYSTRSMRSNQMMMRRAAVAFQARVLEPVASNASSQIRQSVRWPALSKRAPTARRPRVSPASSVQQRSKNWSVPLHAFGMLLADFRRFLCGQHSVFNNLLEHESEAKYRSVQHLKPPFQRSIESILPGIHRHYHAHTRLSTHLMSVRCDDIRRCQSADGCRLSTDF